MIAAGGLSTLMGSIPPFIATLVHIPRDGTPVIVDADVGAEIGCQVTNLSLRVLELKASGVGCSLSTFQVIRIQPYSTQTVPVNLEVSRLQSGIQSETVRIDGLLADKPVTVELPVIVDVRRKR